MTDTFMVKDFSEGQTGQLRVDLSDGLFPGDMFYSTHISAYLPFVKSELRNIQARMVRREPVAHGLGRLAAMEDVGGDPDEAVEIAFGGSVGAMHTKFGIALAQEIMSIRGLDIAVVTIRHRPAHLVFRSNEAQAA